MAKDNDLVTFLAVGDVIIARKDYQNSFGKAEAMLREADITFFNCETPYAEKGTPSLGSYGCTPHDPSKMSVLASAGLDVCSMANNHTGDWGVDATVECRERLEAMGIAVCGAGRDINEARKPAILERKGVRMAFLGYMSTGPYTYRAEEGHPGAATIRAHTLYEPYDYQPGTPPVKVISFAYKEDLQGMVEDIKKAREQADIVIMTDHWGVHHLPVIIPDYGFEVGHAAIDAGADLVLGTHPHILKGIEVYKGKVIVHSLANFAMGGAEGVRTLRSESYAKIMGQCYQRPRAEQSKTIILKCLISGKKIQRISYIPVMLDAEWGNPEPLVNSDPRAKDIFEYMTDITRRAGLDTKYSWEGNEVVIHT